MTENMQQKNTARPQLLKQQTKYHYQLQSQETKLRRKVRCVNCGSGPDGLQYASLSAFNASEVDLV